MTAARGNVLGETEAGRDWCIKALHPSDPLTEVRGIPDESASPSLLMNYQATYTMQPQSGSVGNWGFDATLLPHPCVFMSYSETDNLGTVNGNFLNPQLDGPTADVKYTEFLLLAQRWRLAYMSVTIYQDGPDLANQGTIVVAQTPVQPQKFNWGCTAQLGPAQVNMVGPHLVRYSDEDKPAVNTIMSMPNAYFNKSKEGAYVPLKLTHSCQKWRSDADRIVPLQFIPPALINPTGVTGLQTITGAADWPFYDSVGAWMDPATGLSGGSALSPMLNDCFAHICARNLAVTTNYSFFIRMGLEIQVHPGSILAPHLRLSAPYDPLALREYFAIARELKDAYPADYNDLGKIWDVISSAAKTVAPFLSGVPVLGPALATALPAVANLGDGIKKAIQNRVKKTNTSKQVSSTASAADVELARKVIQAPPPRMSAQRPSRGRGRRANRA